MSFRALLTSKSDDDVITTELAGLGDGDLMPGEVTVDVEHSTVNYKDALAVTGAGRIMRRFPLVPGIDLAGVVAESTDPRFSPGDAVLANGWGLGQTHHGGLAERARVPGDWLVPLPTAFSTRDAMTIGTAGYTAMLCVLALEHGGITPDSGEVLVTGAGGGVGSIAIAILSGLGYRVVASTGRPLEGDYLRGLGAAEIIGRLSEPGKPFTTTRWAGAVDTVGSHTLVNVLAATAYRGVVAACGLAQGNDLPGSVLPFILRNVTLAGIDSAEAPVELRRKAWDRLATDLDPAKLASTATTVALDEVVDTAQRVLAGQVRGRTVVDVRA
ncbi:oxidoreductase [Tessaracoccus sp. OS52]|uniref:acrylyl-CoA reductase (NADPH) n=1 Tax=Tessaracoccus sp. OS52 TaxID=2886691 RepID=UPI001D122B0C|nr:MDR family oxidoreductase [Tessaracoccus sp. OS52]MCC2592026.1 oxidoreductase [Tessaracoccus sp. OS52]